MIIFILIGAALTIQLNQPKSTHWAGQDRTETMKEMALGKK